MTRRKHYHVYVVELSSDVLLNARFMRANPNYSPGKPCVYVGMTGLEPDVRFDKHKAGIRGNAAFAAVAIFTFFGMNAAVWCCTKRNSRQCRRALHSRCRRP
jgi:hypothetical protein